MVEQPHDRRQNQRNPRTSTNPARPKEMVQPHGRRPHVLDLEESACDSESSLEAPTSDAVSKIINRFDTPTFPARKSRTETAKKFLPIPFNKNSITEIAIHPKKRMQKHALRQFSCKKKLLAIAFLSFALTHGNHWY